MARSDIDATDQQLLHAIQRDATLTTDELSCMVASSPSAVQRRLARLRRDGIIAEEVAVVRPSLVGQPLTLVVGVEIERKRADLYANFREWVERAEEVQQAYNVTGASDFILIVTAPTMEDYDALMDRMVNANPNVLKFTTSAVLQTYKRSLFTPVKRSTTKAAATSA